VIVGVIRRKPVLTHASIVCEGMLASVNSVNSVNVRPFQTPDSALCLATLLVKPRVGWTPTNSDGLCRVETIEQCRELTEIQVGELIDRRVDPVVRLAEP